MRDSPCDATGEKSSCDNLKFVKAIALLLGVSIVALAPSLAEAQRSSYVRGYYRKDGTYVAPHYRNAPKPRSFLDDWRNRPWSNPLRTPRVGSSTKTRTRKASSGFGRIPIYRAPRTSYRITNDFRTTKNVYNFNVTVNAPATRDEEWFTWRDRDARMKIARRLEKRKIPANWMTESTITLLERERRYQIADRLKKRNYPADPANQTLEHLEDIEKRIKKADDLRKRGQEVDWQSYSTAELEILNRQSRRR